MVKIILAFPPIFFSTYKNSHYNYAVLYSADTYTQVYATIAHSKYSISEFLSHP
jgi:hypothetical protein